MRSKLYLALVVTCLGCCAFPPSQQYPQQNYQGQGYQGQGYQGQSYSNSGYSGSSAYSNQQPSAYPPPPSFSGQSPQYAPQPQPYSTQQPYSMPQQFQQPTSPYGLGAGASQNWRQQQAGASQWDPYADVDAGPEIVGARPREFNRPIAEPFRGQGFRDTRWPF